MPLFLAPSHSLQVVYSQPLRAAELSRLCDVELSLSLVCWHCSGAAVAWGSADSLCPAAHLSAVTSEPSGYPPSPEGCQHCCFLD